MLRDQLGENHIIAAACRQHHSRATHIACRARMMREQMLRRVMLRKLQRDHQRSRALSDARRMRFDIRTAREQRIHRLHITVLGRILQWRPTIRIRRVDIRRGCDRCRGQHGEHKDWGRFQLLQLTS